MTHSSLLRRVEVVRHFSRFYTRKIGVLHEALLESQFTLAEGRVVYELAHHETATATELAKELGLDPGYLSRIVRALEDRAVIERRPAAHDGRQHLISLTERGQEEFAVINARSRNEISALLETLSEADQQRLVESLDTARRLLGDEPPRRVPYILRPHQPGDIGWVIHRHGVLYAREFGWDETFEALVAEIAATFIRQFDPSRERCWIAEKDGENVGSVFLVRDGEEIAKLRLLLVEPSARGLGIGGRLVDECVRFARQRGYRKITLWTNDVLLAARHIYQQAGFSLVHKEDHHSFGHDLVGENWELDL